MLKEGDSLLRTLPYLPGELMASEEERNFLQQHNRWDVALTPNSFQKHCRNSLGH